MRIVWLTALGVGGATVFGAIMGFLFQKTSRRFSDVVLSFAAGVMLASAMLGLILPSLEYGGRFGFLWATAGIFGGAFCLNRLNRCLPRIYRLMGVPAEGEGHTKLGRVLLFVTAIAIHNFPEGIAAGVGFGTGDASQAIAIAGGIALQNIPEGMVMIAPMLAVGISPSKTFVCAALTGMIEVAGTLLGYIAVRAATAILPFALSFAGGTMLYVISDEMIPQTHEDGGGQRATYSLLLGVCLVLVMEAFLG
ncbi:MAG: ZIP family metal transporter [Clostridia bacterium]|nr:ZIP family metal transporter [Clostridia bacterium]